MSEALGSPSPEEMSQAVRDRAEFLLREPSYELTESFYHRSFPPGWKLFIRDIRVDEAIEDEDDDSHRRNISLAFDKDMLPVSGGELDEYQIFCMRAGRLRSGGVSGRFMAQGPNAVPPKELMPLQPGEATSALVGMVYSLMDKEFGPELTYWDRCLPLTKKFNGRFEHEELSNIWDITTQLLEEGLTVKQEVRNVYYSDESKIWIIRQSDSGDRRHVENDEIYRERLGRPRLYVSLKTAAPDPYVFRYMLMPDGKGYTSHGWVGPETQRFVPVSEQPMLDSSILETIISRLDAIPK